MIVETLKDALRAVNGGYLCRDQKMELKYMVAFYDPQVCRHHPLLPNHCCFNGLFALQ